MKVLGAIHGQANPTRKKFKMKIYEKNWNNNNSCLVNWIDGF